MSVGGAPIRLRITGKVKALRKVWTSRATPGELVWRCCDLFLHVAVNDTTTLASAPPCLTAIGADMNAIGHLIVAVACDLTRKVLGTFGGPAE